MCVSIADPINLMLLYKTGGLTVAAVGNIRRLSDSVAANAFRAILNKQIGDIRDAGTYKNERVITSPQATSICVKGSNGKILNFCANNYLGLSVWAKWTVRNWLKNCYVILYFLYFQQKDNEEIIRFSKGMLDARGCGLSSVRFICGTQDIHKVRKKSFI